MAIRCRPLTTDAAYLQLFNDMMLERRTALPGIIRGVNIEDGALKSVDVQGSISLLTSVFPNAPDTSRVLELPVIPNVPVVLPYSQTTGYALTVPISVGDDCLLIFADRSIDQWQEFGGVQLPSEDIYPRSHELTDAICIPGAINNQSAISNYDTDGIVIRNKDNTVCIKLTDDNIVIKQDANIIEMNLTEINITHSALISLTAPAIQLNGDITGGTSGGSTADFQGTLSADEVEANGIPLSTHVHGGVQTGGGTTGGPQ